ncbi:FtsW/RodA/SpoVE family cell cycle protein [Brevibacillus porteri]|uniref:FtsW/RodA/SpoVE family cell cycle protein n=1 Tax=Brevibacillus porteri TaxID=2126350 RepID=A0ABX5FWL3_9BACL|nr:FtsW/RodA/SpoVE family cell cycle protein [Brevibacillus porteri]MED1801075.1 FtsW/RodA/SpoVE family cell cycle protein [Brevibacillus porteri]MED2130461.1 FtsW/RodA/SpoVE family cell cycle protein [Brevibacillus porteri]MED2745210.1 FtsW/RodA/SpoVE family cell cycle protein [Brevibacillus porteri]MED2812701.1 FtsW/RodA/SpoVE family cell cycle protein [Brevibacillus porteri]MED2895325.1 FtsW/RodA/SpoVE family cell cycle protein [Brevibacillus porteri]
MKQTNTHPLIADYLDQVCRHVRATEMHRRIRDEMESHLLDLMDEQMDDGVEEEEAVRQAILQMGDSAAVGKQLHRIYKPKVEWRLLAYVLGFLVVGLFTMYGTPVNYFTEKVDRYWLSSLMGVGLMLTIAFTDYRKLLQYSFHLYVLPVGMLLFLIWYEYYVHGNLISDTSHFRNIPFGPISMYLFLISIAGMLLTRTWRFRSTASKLMVFVLLPAILLLMTQSYLHLKLYIFGFLVLLMYTKTVRKEKLLLFIASVGAFIGAWLLDNYTFERILDWMQPTKDPQGGGYMYLLTMETIRSAGFWGHGFGAPSQMPRIDTAFKFAYLIQSYGWFGGLLISLVVALFMMRLARVIKEVDEPYGKHLIVSIVPIFSLHFFWPLLMSVGMLPTISDLVIPFLSYSLIGFALINFAILGLILSVHRHRNSIGKPHTFLAK